VSLSQDRPQPGAPPNIEIVSHKWVMYVATGGPAVMSAPSQTIERSGEANDPMKPVTPNPEIPKRPHTVQRYVYSVEVLNNGRKEIKALKWDYIFSDPVTHEELKRLSGFGDAAIRPSQKKTMQINTLSPPLRVINGSAPNSASPYEERVEIRCVVFADGSLWQKPETKNNACDNLQTGKTGRK